VLFSIDGNTLKGLGKMINDSKKGNCKMKKLVVNGKPHLCLFAIHDIEIGDQLLYDYGDDEQRLFWRSKVS